MLLCLESDSGNGVCGVMPGCGMEANCNCEVMASVQKGLLLPMLFCEGNMQGKGNFIMVLTAAGLNNRMDNRRPNLPAMG